MSRVLRFRFLQTTIGPARAFARRVAGSVIAISAVLAPVAALATSRPALSGGAVLASLRGESGQLAAVLRAPGQPLVAGGSQEFVAHYVPESGASVVSAGLAAPQRPGVYSVALEAAAGRTEFPDLRLITLVPFAAKKNGQIGAYRLGTWPYENGRAPSSAYANPAGFVEVTRENRGLRVSKHFTLGDFLTKDQPDVWPKYLLLDARLIDKLELVIGELEAAGHAIAHLSVMSGFRTPRYNEGGGTTSGRSSISRHMYGDATDVFVDNDRDGRSDDLDRDGHVDIRDAEVFAGAADRVEARYPALVGGVGVYPGNRSHGPFTHVDVRGKRARWRG